MKHLFDMVKHGKITTVPSHFAIKYQEKLTVFYYIFNGGSLADYQQTVCIVYPNQTRAWIIEGKSIKKVYGEDEQKKIFSQIKSNRLVALE